MQEDGLWTMSAETRVSSVYSRTPPVGGRAGRLGEGGVDLFLGGVGPDGGHEVGDRPGGYGHPQRHPVETALELGQHRADRPGGAGGARDDRQGGGARMRRRSGLPVRDTVAMSCNCWSDV